MKAGRADDRLSVFPPGIQMPAAFTFSAGLLSDDPLPAERVSGKRAFCADLPGGTAVPAQSVSGCDSGAQDMEHQWGSDPFDGETAF